MELNHKQITLSVQGHLDGDIKVLKNGIDEGIKLKHLFKEVWFTTGKIQGYSILEFYTVKDGFLVDNEGNKISFSCDRFPEINILKLSDPSFPTIIYDEIEVPTEWLVTRAKLLGINKIEEIIKGLSEEDKNVLIAERQEAEAKAKAEEDERLAEEARKAEEEAVTASEIKRAEKAREEAEEEARLSEEARIKAEQETEIARVAQEKAEEERKRVEAEEAPYILTEAQYNTAKRRYSKAYGMKEYVNGTYHFFYAPKSSLPKDMASYILRKNEDGTYLQLEGGIALEDEESVEFEFTDKDVDKVLFLNVENEEVTIQ